uniref:RNA-binding protein Nova-2 n=1 Tax=Ascaris suum TaxID=6253 RepID=F1KY54_ASCSU
MSSVMSTDMKRDELLDEEAQVVDNGLTGNTACVQSATTLPSGQKRLRDDHGAPASKKAHIVDNEESVQVKILIPSAAVGAIIGKGGETMRSLKNESGCRLQMSKNQEVYHGTNERICLVKGKIASVMKVVEVVMEKIKEKVDPNTPCDVYDHKGVDRTKEMKLLVPNTSAGMVIGKSGARIKEIRDQTGANIQVYPKAGSQEAKVSLERVITIAADDSDVLMNAIQRVLEKVAADPQHASAIEHKELEAFGGLHGHSGAQAQSVQPFDFTGRQGGGAPFGAVQQTQFGQVGAAQVWQPPQQQRVLEAAYGTPNKELYSNGAGNTFKFNPMQGLGNNELLAFLDSLQSTLRTSGFNETSVAEVMQAMQVLAKYNIMGLGLGLGVAAMAQMRSNEPGALQQAQSLMQAQRYDGNTALGPSSLLDAAERHYIPHSDVNKSLGGVGGVLIDVMSQSKAGGGSSGGPNFASTVIKEKVVDSGHVELEVPDAIVGAVLGPKAKTLAEIQHLSGCKVEVHKRGAVAAQGNRLISLSGDAECIRNGRLMIEKVINDEQARRNQQAHHNRGSFV